MNWGELLNNFGFAVVMCGAMGFFVKYMYDNNRADMNNLHSLHKSEMDSVVEAVNNNSLVMQKLIDKLESSKLEEEYEAD